MGDEKDQQDQKSEAPDAPQTVEVEDAQGNTVETDAGVDPSRPVTPNNPFPGTQSEEGEEKTKEFLGDLDEDAPANATSYEGSHAPSDLPPQRETNDQAASGSDKPAADAPKSSEGGGVFGKKSGSSDKK
jgi:hypothetical protein